MVIENPLQMMTARQLEIGQVVKVEAIPTGKRYRATSLSLQQPIVGPITAISPDWDSLRVMEQEVLLDGGNLKQPFTRSLQVGDSISVSGLWEQNRVHATHLDRAPEGYASISGPASIHEQQTYIGQVPVHPGEHHLQGLKPGTLVSAIGKPADNQRAMTLTRPTASHDMPFGHHIKNVLIEGYPAFDQQGARMEHLRINSQGLQRGKRQLIRGNLSRDNQVKVIQQPSIGGKSNNLFRERTNFKRGSGATQKPEVIRHSSPSANNRSRTSNRGGRGGRR